MLGLLRHPVRLVYGRPEEFPKRRDHGFTDGRTITVAPKMANAPVRVVVAILAHEVAHCCYLQNGVSHSEIGADTLASKLIGAHVGYDRTDTQSVGSKRSRPSYLPNPRK